MILNVKLSLYQGHSDGGDIGIYPPPKSAQVNFLWGKNDIRTAIQQFYTPLPVIVSVVPNQRRVRKVQFAYGGELEIARHCS